MNADDRDNYDSDMHHAVELIMFNDQRHLLLINYCKAKFKSLPTFKHETQVFFREFVMY